MRPAGDCLGEGAHREQGLHERAFVVGGAAADHPAVARDAGERRRAPALLVDRLHIAMDDEAQHRRAGGARQLDLGHGSGLAHGEAQLLAHAAQPLFLRRVRPLVSRHGVEAQHLGEQRHEPRRLLRVVVALGSGCGRGCCQQGCCENGHRGLLLEPAEPARAED
jgi:hypothetical protein